MKCLIVQPIHMAGQRLLLDHGITPVVAPDTRLDTVRGLLAGCDAAITRDHGLSAAEFAGGDCLRVVVVHGTGHDAVDKSAAAERGILVCNTPGANARSVSELALGLMLAAARGIPAADRAERAGISGFRESTSFSELSGKTALIVGWGAIGSGLGQMLSAAFGMRVMAYSPRGVIEPPFERVERLEDALPLADVVSLHTPLRAETRHLINPQRLALMKRGAILVNTGRAGLVDETALAEALSSGHIGAAGLDVYDHSAPAGPLAAFPNVIFTPHLGATTEEALRRVAEGAAGHVITALRGELPATALNPDVWSVTAPAN